MAKNGPAKGNGGAAEWNSGPVHRCSRRVCGPYEGLRPAVYQISRRHVFLFRRLMRPFLEAEAFELAIKRRSPDFQPPRDLRHLPAVMRDGEADHFALRSPRAAARRRARRSAAATAWLTRRACRPDARRPRARPARSAAMRRRRHRSAAARQRRRPPTWAAICGNSSTPICRRRPAPPRGTPRSRAGAHCPASGRRRAAPAPRR